MRNNAFTFSVEHIQMAFSGTNEPFSQESDGDGAEGSGGNDRNFMRSPDQQNLINEEIKEVTPTWSDPPGQRFEFGLIIKAKESVESESEANRYANC